MTFSGSGSGSGSGQNSVAPGGSGSGSGSGSLIFSIRPKYVHLFCFGSGKTFVWRERELLSPCWTQNEQSMLKA